MTAAAHGGLFRAHDLLRLADPSQLARADPALPAWARDAVQATGWVVVRRGRPAPGTVCAGIRGPARAQRYACTVDAADVVAVLTPLRVRDRIPGRAAGPPALRAARALRERWSLERPGLPWGPTGSVGFHLATGNASVHPGSDLDLTIDCRTRLPASTARAILADLGELDCAADCQLETPSGAVHLAEWARQPGEVLLRTIDGPVLTDDPWRPGGRR